MKYIRYAALAVIIGLIGLFIFISFFVIRIRPGEVGVRTQQYAIFGEKGVQSRDYEPGYHRNFPIVDTWNIFDATVQTTEFTTPEERQEARRRWENFLSDRSSDGALDNYPVTGPERIELKSRDGYTVKLDVTVKYRPKPEEVFELYKEFQSEVGYKSIVRDRAQNTLRNVLGTMDTEDFYDPSVRREKTSEAFDRLKEELNTSHVELIDILIRDITFDATYERKILDKKLADQDVELNKSRALAEEKKGLTNVILAETEAKVRVIEQEKKAEELTLRSETDRKISQIRADARVTVSKTKADANLYADRLNADGKLLEEKARADGERLKAQALQGGGGANYVALHAVRDLNLGDTIVSTLDVQFLDVDTMVRQFGANTEAAVPSQQAAAEGGDPETTEDEGAAVAAK